MGRKRKKYASTHDAIKRWLVRDHNQELAGQTKLKHYRATKNQMVECTVCHATGVRFHRHRIIPGPIGDYIDSNIKIVCVPCHKVNS